MRRGKKRAVDSEDNIDMTPMLDVVFIMLIFFLVTASFVKEAGIEVNQPESTTATSQGQGSVMIAITDTDQIWIDNRIVDVRAVRANVERFRAENPKMGVVIQSDTNARTGLLVKVMDAVRDAGIHNISIAADSPK